MKIHDILKVLKREVESEYLNNIEPYWYKHSMDDKYGGFFGRIAYNNTPIDDAEKGGILNARILWTFSAAYKIFGTKEAKELAHRAYHYLTDFLFDKKEGGIFWLVNHKGNVSDDRKHVYVQAFAIYGLAEYYSAFGQKEALDYAFQLFNLIEEHCKDSVYGGYFEAYSRNWQPIKDTRLSDKDKNEPKSMNTHLHVLEGYTNLYRFAPTENVEKSLRQLLAIFDEQIFSENKDSLNCFFEEDWTKKSSRISFGHDIEASWLCVESAEVLGIPHWINIFKTIALKVSLKIILATDPDGGIINEITRDKILDDDKDWWPQAEALVGHLNAFEISKNSNFLNASCKSWDFIKAHIIDNKYGDWYEKVNREGKPYSQLDKVRSWKAPYHNSRAMFEVSKRVNLLLEQNISEENLLTINNEN